MALKYDHFELLMFRVYCCNFSTSHLYTLLKFHILGSNVTLKVDVEGLKEKDTVLYVHLLDNSRHEIESYNFTDYEEAGEMIGMAPIQIPDQVCHVLNLWSLYIDTIANQSRMFSICNYYGSA